MSADHTDSPIPCNRCGGKKYLPRVGAKVLGKHDPLIACPVCSPPVFHIRMEADYHLTVAEVWPDGDHPDNPTADDVAAAMRAHGSQRRTLRDWNLDESVVTVDDVEVWE